MAAKKPAKAKAPRKSARKSEPKPSEGQVAEAGQAPPTRSVTDRLDAIERQAIVHGWDIFPSDEG